jgi:hypothetical protein
MIAEQKNPKTIIKIGYVFVLAFFAMNLLPHPTTKVSDDVFDGVHGLLLGVAMGLLILGTYLNGKARRARD